VTEEPAARRRRPVAGRGGRVARLLARVAAASAVVGTVLLVVANVVVVTRTDAVVTDRAADLRPAQVAIVPGSLVLDDGSLGNVVEERVAAAVALHRAGTVDKILMSGDNGTLDYDEPGAMRDAALAAGVPPEDVFTDYAGFSTWQTMGRAVGVFGVRTAVVVTQDPYAARAVDLARAAGLDAQALVAGDVGVSARELLARVRGLAEATFRPAVTGGEPIPIEGDGRASWAGAPQAAGG
jgi:SanA protein